MFLLFLEGEGRVKDWKAGSENGIWCMIGPPGILPRTYAWV